MFTEFYGLHQKYKINTEYFCCIKNYRLTNLFPSQQNAKFPRKKSKAHLYPSVPSLSLLQKFPIETCVKHCPLLKGTKMTSLHVTLTTKVVHCLAKQCHHISLVMKSVPLCPADGASVLPSLPLSQSLYVWHGAAFRT